jgi:hypothetical protein
MHNSCAGQMSNTKTARSVLIDPVSGGIDARQWALPKEHLSERIDTTVFDFIFADHIFLDSNFVINAIERDYVRYKIYIFRERAIRKQRLIEHDLRVARRTGNRALYLECHRDLKKLNRQFWNLRSVLKCKVLVKRKGTERSRSKSGSQTICTHTNPIFERDCEERWLLGLASEISRASNARNRVKDGAPFTARPEALRLTTQYFADAKTDVRQRRFRTQIRTATLFRKGKQMGDGRSGGSIGLPTRDQSHHCYSTDWCRYVYRNDTAPSGVVRLRHLGSSDRRRRMASCSISPS